MYFFDEAVEKCGFYECRECNYRFLSKSMAKRTECPLCIQNINYEIGPDESLEDLLESADLIDVIEGQADIERMDALLSCAFSEDDSWI